MVFAIQAITLYINGNKNRSSLRLPPTNSSETSAPRCTECAQFGGERKPHVFMSLYEFTGRTGLALYRGLSALYAANFSTATFAVCAEQRWMRR